MRIAFLTVFLFLSFSARCQKVDSNLAVVNQVRGLYVFVDSRPVREYQYLGSVRRTFISCYYNKVRASIVRKVRKRYPNASAIIFYPSDYRADVIRFK